MRSLREFMDANEQCPKCIELHKEITKRLEEFKKFQYYLQAHFRESHNVDTSEIDNLLVSTKAFVYDKVDRIKDGI